jgi:hypothetical protein
VRRGGIGTELGVEPLDGFHLPAQDEIVGVAGDLDGVVEFAHLGHVHPHPGAAQMFADAVQTELDDLADPSPAPHLDRPDVCHAAVVRIPRVEQRDVRRVAQRGQHGVVNGRGFFDDGARAPPNGKATMNSRGSPAGFAAPDSSAQRSTRRTAFMVSA